MLMHPAPSSETSSFPNLRIFMLFPPSVLSFPLLVAPRRPDEAHDAPMVIAATTRAASAYRSRRLTVRCGRGFSGSMVRSLRRRAGLVERERGRQLTVDRVREAWTRAESEGRWPAGVQPHVADADRGARRLRWLTQRADVQNSMISRYTARVARPRNPT